MTYLWDTNTASAAMEEHTGVTQRVDALDEVDDLAICSVTRGEILFGIARLPESRRRSDLTEKATAVFDSTVCLPVTEDVADAYADIKASVERLGRPIGKENDLWIAAVAQAYECILVSGQASFGYVPELQVDDWTA